MTSYADSNWARSMDDQELTSGYVFSLGTSAISSARKKQHDVSLSSTKGEYRAIRGESEAVSLRIIIANLMVEQTKPTILLCD